MGWFDRFKRAHKPPQAQAPAIVLKAREIDRWDAQLLRHHKIEEEFASFQEKVEAAKSAVKGTLPPYTEEKILEAVPERARTVVHLNAKEFQEQTRKLLDTASFSGIWAFEQEHANFLEQQSEHQERTKKQAFALHEYLEERLGATNGLLEQLEDTILAFGQFLETAHFDELMAIHKAAQERAILLERREKYRELLDSLKQDLARTQGRRQAIEEKIAEQRDLIRNEPAREALDSLVRIERELDERLALYEHAARDLLAHLKKHDLKPGQGVRAAASDLHKDALHALMEDAERIGALLEDAADLLQNEGRGNVSNLVSRLKKAGEQAPSDAARCRELRPQQTELKKAIMRDVAALKVYDQQQFLLRAGREEQEIAKKIDFLEEELSDKHLIAIERRMRDAARRIPVEVVGAQEEDSGEEIADIDDEELDEEVEEVREDLAEEAEDLAATQREKSGTAVGMNERAQPHPEDVEEALAEAEREVRSAQELIDEASEEIGHRKN